LLGANPSSTYKSRRHPNKKEEERDPYTLMIHTSFHLKIEGLH
jgi:hypothetical protein